MFALGGGATPVAEIKGFQTVWSMLDRAGSSTVWKPSIQLKNFFPQLRPVKWTVWHACRRDCAGGNKNMVFPSLSGDGVEIEMHRAHPTAEDLGDGVPGFMLVEGSHEGYLMQVNAGNSDDPLETPGY